jgi:hypothetical protein
VKLEFSGRLSGVYLPKSIDASKRSVPLSLSLSGFVYPSGSFSPESASAVQYLRVTHWVNSSEYEIEFDTWSARVGSDLLIEIEHSYEKNSAGYGEWRDRLRVIL